MKLFSSPTSPYARKVRILIAEYGLEDQVQVENHAPMEDPVALHKVNPAGKVPVLVNDEGEAIYDSPVICEYLDELNGGHFVPRQGEQRFDCLRRQAMADGVLDAAFSRTMERLRAEGERSQMWMTRWEQAILRALDVMVNETETANDRFDLGDIASVCALGYLDLRHGDLNWRHGRDSLAAWFENHLKRPSVKASQPLT